MGNPLSHLLEDALRLPTDERSAVVAALIDSLPVGEDDGISKAWRSELLKRREDLRSGRTIALPWAEARGFNQSTVHLTTTSLADPLPVN